MTPIFLESFELFRVGGEQSFADFLAENGYSVTGNPVWTPDRSSYANAASLQLGGFSYSVEAIAPVVAFGFAARVSESAVAFELHPSLPVTLGEITQLAGVDGPNPTPLDQWLYYEFVVDKIARTVALHINGQYQQDYPLPDAMRFLTTFNPRFFEADGLCVDDLYVSTDAPMGPISARAYPTDVDLPVVLSAAGQSTSGTPVETVEEGNIQAVSVKARTRITDLDAREVEVFAGGQGRAIVPSTKNTYRGAIFEQRAAGTPWVPDDIKSTQFGVRIVR